MLELILYLIINLGSMTALNTADINKTTMQTPTPSAISENVQLKATPTPAASSIPIETLIPTTQPTPASPVVQTPSPTPSAQPETTPTPQSEDAQKDTPETLTTPLPTPVEEEEEMDYIAELTKLGYIYNEFEDKDINTRNGVLRFQADSNLLVDGIYGPDTSASLRKRIKDTSFTYTDSVSSAPSAGYWIYINKTRRILTLYKGNEVVKKYPVAVGNPPSLTPEGHFKILIKVVNPIWGGGGYAQPVAGGIPENPLGYRWMGLDLGGGGEYGVHGNNAPYSIGTYASHGCIRMINADVESLFEIVPEGTPVWIGSDASLANDGITQTEYK